MRLLRKLCRSSRNTASGRRRHFCRASLITLAALLGTLAAAADPRAAPIFEITRIYTGDDKLSRFADGAVELQLKDFAPPTPAIAVSRKLPGNGLTFATLPAGWFGDWHPAPEVQYVLILSGTFEIETGDGEIRRIGAGAALLVEDIDGPGHRTRVVSDDAVVLAIVPTAR